MTGLPRIEDSVCSACRSGKRKSGAAIGASSQVSTVIGSVRSAEVAHPSCSLRLVACLKGFQSRWFRAFFQPDSMIDRQIVQFLHQPTGPSDRSAHRPFRRAQAKEDILAVLREKTRSRLERSRLAARFGLHGDERADRVAIAFVPRRRNAIDGGKFCHDVLQNSQLRAFRFFRKTS